ncbi:MAG: FAD-dependent oxidoreductase, partial [Devosia sp.]
MARRIAVIGSGVSGLSAAWLLAGQNAVTVYEKAPRLGGHVNTVTAQTPDGAVAVDTGFIVYNERNFPNLTALFAHLGVKTAPSDMSFSVSLDQGAMEYSGRHLNGLFGQRSNIIRIEHWRLVSDILRFFREAERGLDSISDEISIGKYLADNG